MQFLALVYPEKLEGKDKDAVEYINNQRAKVYAVDIPSGIDGSTGEVWSRD